MARRQYVWHNGEWVEYDRYAPRPKPAGPMIIRDIEPYACVVDGERITTRRRHREKLRETGCVEWGDQRPWQKSKDLPPVAPDLKRAVEQVRAGYKPPPLPTGVLPEE